MMKRLILRTLGGLFALLLLLTLGEAQIFRYGADRLRAALAPAPVTRADRAPPQALLDGLAHDPAELTLLAAGDVAECARHDALGQFWPALTGDLGLPIASDDSASLARDTATLAAATPGALVLGLGDLAYHRGTTTEYETCFDPLWGALVPRMLPTPGNHDYRTIQATGYYDYWRQQAGAGQEGYYAVRWQNWLLLSLNSEVDAAPGSAQAEWLEAQLAAAPEACVLAYFHKPAWSLRERVHSEAARALFARLDRAGATAVLNGHNHFYERTLPLDPEGQPARDGLVGFTIGVGGETSGPAPLAPTTARAIFGAPGLLEITLQEGALSWDFLRAPDGAALDSGQIPCRARGPAPERHAALAARP